MNGGQAMVVYIVMTVAVTIGLTTLGIFFLDYREKAMRFKRRMLQMKRREGKAELEQRVDRIERMLAIQDEQFAALKESIETAIIRADDSRELHQRVGDGEQT